MFENSVRTCVCGVKFYPHARAMKSAPEDDVMIQSSIIHGGKKFLGTR
jgi:hypothetical protein